MKGWACARGKHVACTGTINFGRFRGEPPLSEPCTCHCHEKPATSAARAA